MFNSDVEIVAEIGSVHDGSLGNAIALIKLAADSGASVVKFQHHIAHEESAHDAPSPNFFRQEDRYKYFQRISFNKSQWKELYEIAHSLGVKFGCSVFSVKSLHDLMETGIDIVKVPSGEVTNIPLLNEIAKTNKAIHLSSGMSDWIEIENAMRVLGNIKDLTLLQCTSRYPTPPIHIGLNIIGEMKKRFQTTIGFSDHSTGIEFSIAAVSVGAQVIEKHLTFSRKMYGSDAFNALEPAEFEQLSRGVRNIATALRNPVDKNNLDGLQEMRQVFQKSIFAAKDMERNHKIEFQDLKFLKPGNGIPASKFQEIIGRTTGGFVNKDQMLKWSDIR